MMLNSKKKMQVQSVSRSKFGSLITSVYLFSDYELLQHLYGFLLYKTQNF